MKTNFSEFTDSHGAARAMASYWKNNWYPKKAKTQFTRDNKCHRGLCSSKKSLAGGKEFWMAKFYRTANAGEDYLEMSKNHTFIWSNVENSTYFSHYQQVVIPKQTLRLSFKDKWNPYFPSNGFAFLQCRQPMRHQTHNPNYFFFAACT